MSGLLLRPLYKKLNQMIYDCNFRACAFQGWCIICECEYEWIGHKGKPEHLYRLRSIAEQLMNTLLPPGIILRIRDGDDDDGEDDDDGKTSTFVNDIYCVICQESVTTLLFDTDFHAHINSLGHQLEVLQQTTKLKEVFNLNEFFDAVTRIIGPEEATLIEGVSRAGLMIDEHDGSLLCALCRDFKINNEEQFVSHVTDSAHVAEVTNQLINVTMLLGFGNGIILRPSGSFYCTLCEMKLGNGLPDTCQVHAHIANYAATSPTAARHRKNVSIHFHDYGIVHAESYDGSTVYESSDTWSDSSSDSCGEFYVNDDGDHDRLLESGDELEPLERHDL